MFLFTYLIVLLFFPSFFLRILNRNGGAGASCSDIFFALLLIISIMISLIIDGRGGVIQGLGSDTGNPLRWRCVEDIDTAWCNWPPPPPPPPPRPGPFVPVRTVRQKSPPWRGPTTTSSWPSAPPTGSSSCSTKTARRRTSSPPNRSTPRLVNVYALLPLNVEVWT